MDRLISTSTTLKSDVGVCQSERSVLGITKAVAALKLRASAYARNLLARLCQRLGERIWSIFGHRPLAPCAAWSPSPDDLGDARQRRQGRIGHWRAGRHRGRF